MSDNGGIDWLRVVIHGFFGLLAGAVLGLGVWVVWAYRFEDGWAVILAAAALVALLAAVLGDAFWTSAADNEDRPFWIRVLLRMVMVLFGRWR